MPGRRKEFIYVMCFAQWGLSPSLSSKTKHCVWYAIKPCDHFYCEHLPFKPLFFNRIMKFFMFEHKNIEEYNTNGWLWHIKIRKTHCNIYNYRLVLLESYQSKNVFFSIVKLLFSITIQCMNCNSIGHLKTFDSMYKNS